MSTRQQYEALTTAENLPVFFEAWYLDAVLGEDKWNFVHEEQGGTCKAIWVYYPKQKLGLKYYPFPTLWRYNGPLILGDVDEEQIIIERLYKKIPKSNNHKFQSAPKLVLKPWKTWTFKERVTYHWQMMDRTMCLDKMANNYERAILQNAEEITCEYIASDDLRIQELYRLMNLSFGPIEDHELYPKEIERVFKAADEKGQAKLLLLKYNNAYIAGCLLIWDKEAGYYLLAGNDRAYNKIYPGLQMGWYAHQFLAEHTEVNYLDFLGSDIPNVARIWKKLGAEKKQYLFGEYRSALFDKLDQAKSIISQFKS